ncbi:hypothetical protein F4781DRAFT_205104 [Annulohypoxylon bovei var. microspora]|nr:hypothetical protein F4781DRAFT_205104 [Annulohypoxylon bovei var. microspora]
MENYPRSPLSSPSHSRNINNADSLRNIKTFGITCDFLDPLRTYTGVSGDTIAATPNLHLLHSIPTFQTDRPAGSYRDPPVNASLVDGSSNSRNKGRQSQWQSSWRFMNKIDEYHQKLQECLSQDTPRDLRDWLRTYRKPKDIRNCGLRALGDILQNEIPSEFPEILSAMVVQHAISHYACERNSFEEDVQSAFMSWRNTVSLNGTNQESLDIVFGRLKLADESSLEDARPTRPPYETQVFETGRQFTNPGPSSYPQTLGINDNSLSIWPFPNPNFARLNGEYPPYQLNQPQPLNPFGPLGSQYFMPFVASTNRNQSFPSIEIDTSTFSPPPQLHDSSQSYEYSQPSSYRPHETQLSPSALNQTAPFVVFTRFIDNFMDQGDLHLLFSQEPIRWNSLPLSSNARFSEKLVFSKIENTLLGPLKISISQSSQHPIAQAIVSTTWSMALLGTLHSVADTVNYMIQLSVSLFPNVGSCLDFARVVLEACPASHVADVSNSSTSRRGRKTNQCLEQQLDTIEREFHGNYHPSYLFASQDSHSRDSRTLQSKQPTIPSQASTSQPTPSVIDSTGSYTASLFGTNTENSTAYESNTNTTTIVRCDQCDKTFKGRNFSSHLSRHKRSHMNGTMKCPGRDCTKIFKGGRTDNIRAHCRNVHDLTLPEDGRAFWARLNGSPE